MEDPDDVDEDELALAISTELCRPTPVTQPLRKAHSFGSLTLETKVLSTFLKSLPLDCPAFPTSSTF